MWRSDVVKLMQVLCEVGRAEIRPLRRETPCRSEEGSDCTESQDREVNKESLERICVVSKGKTSRADD